MSRMYKLVKLITIIKFYLFLNSHNAKQILIIIMFKIKFELK